ncbi:MAG: hypothetical protein ACRD3H_02590 [Terriglobales bacterium]
MRRLFLFAVGLTLCAGVVFVLRNAVHQNSFREVQDDRPLQSAAFRDGLYLGVLAAKRGEEPHVAEGRWSNQANRISFTAGYQQGYDGAIAMRAAVVKGAH